MTGDRFPNVIDMSFPSFLGHAGHGMESSTILQQRYDRDKQPHHNMCEVSVLLYVRVFVLLGWQYVLSRHGQFIVDAGTHCFVVGRSKKKDPHRVPSLRYGVIEEPLARAR